MKKRKILITIIVAAVLLIAGILLWKVFLTENKVPQKFPADPPKKTEKELQEAALKNGDMNFPGLILMKTAT